MGYHTTTTKPTTREVNFDANRTSYPRTDYAGPEAGGERCSSFAAMPRAWDRDKDLLQLAQKTWRHSSMDASLMPWLKSLSAENARIKWMYAEVSMQNGLLKDALKKVTRPCDRKELAKQAVAAKQASIRLACATFGTSETCYRHERRERGDCRLAVTLDGGAQEVGLRSVFFALAQREGLSLKPQAGVPD